MLVANAIQSTKAESESEKNTKTCLKYAQIKSNCYFSTCIVDRRRSYSIHTHTYICIKPLHRNEEKNTPIFLLTTLHLSVLLPLLFRTSDWFCWLVVVAAAVVADLIIFVLPLHISLINNSVNCTNVCRDSCFRFGHYCLEMEPSTYTHNLTFRMCS